MEWQLVIFDLDGTLLNTISDLGHACNYALEKLGLPQHPIDAYNRMVGNGLRKMVERAAPEADTETIDRLLVLCKEYYDKHCMDTTKPYPGIPELLQTLNEKGVKLAVASNKYQEAVERIVRHYFPEIPFIAVEGQREGRPIKPDPTIITNIIESAGLPKESVAMVGDSVVDIEMARRAGVTSIAVSWGFSSAADLEPCHPDYLITEPRQPQP